MQECNIHTTCKYINIVMKRTEDRKLTTGTRNRSHMFSGPFHQHGTVTSPCQSALKLMTVPTPNAS